MQWTGWAGTFFGVQRKAKRNFILLVGGKLPILRRKEALGSLPLSPRIRPCKVQLEILQRKNSLWACVFAQKYTRRRNSTRGFRGRICSKTRSAMARVNEVFKRGSKWMVGKNSSPSFWFDKWLDKATIRSLVVGLLNRGEDELCIKDMVSPNGWN